MVERWGTFQRSNCKTALNLKLVVENLDFFGTQLRTRHLVVTHAAFEQNLSEHGRPLVTQRGRGMGQ